LFIAFVLSAQSASAGDVQYEVGGGYAYFAGEQYKSLAPKTGYMLRFGAGEGRKSVLKWVSNLTLLTSSGTSDFTDNGSNVNLSYQLIGGEFNLGLKIAPLSGLDRLPIQPYVGATGSAMAASFKFADNAPVSTQFPRTEAQNFYGYTIFVGADIELSKDIWGVNFQVEQSKITGTVAKQPFFLDSNRIFMSLFFRP
jgi:hypothetical protein